MLIKKEDRVQIQISLDSYVWEYPLNNKELGVCSSKITGRFPERGIVVNKECDEIYCVISGRGKVFIEDEKFALEEGDVLWIKAGKKYYVEGNELVLIVVNSPEWYVEQTEIFD